MKWNFDQVPHRLIKEISQTPRAALAAQRAATLRPAQADATGTQSKERSLRLRFLVVPALFVAMASATPAHAFSSMINSECKITALPFTAGIHLTSDAVGLKTRKNLGDAAELLLSRMRETHYQHRTDVDRSRGVYNMDCSGFVDYLLKRTAPGQFAALRIEPGHSRPRAAMYFELFNRLPKSLSPGWEAVQKLRDAQRGDIIAWELAASTQERGDTGHVVIVAAAPVQQTNHRYRVEVYDSSVIHHDDDSRPDGTTGLGGGVITFSVGPGGEPVGFQFNSRARFHEEPIALGRLVNS